MKRNDSSTKKHRWLFIWCNHSNNGQNDGGVGAGDGDDGDSDGDDDDDMDGGDDDADDDDADDGRVAFSTSIKTLNLSRLRKVCLQARRLAQQHARARCLLRLEAQCTHARLSH